MQNPVVNSFSRRELSYKFSHKERAQPKGRAKYQELGRKAEPNIKSSAEGPSQISSAKPNIRMNYQKLSNGDLISQLQTHVADERRITAEVLKLLSEVARRRLFAELGFSSLFDYCVKELKYSESAAYRRISAMRLLKDMPEVEEKIQSGTLTLSTAATLHTFFKNEQKQEKSYSMEERREVLASVESKSARDTEKTLMALSPAAFVREDKERVLSETKTEIRFVADQELMAKFEKLKNLLSHKHSELNYAELFHQLADLALKKLDPETKKMMRGNTDVASDASEVLSSRTSSRYIPAALKRAVWQRDRGCCSYKNALTGRRCESRYQLELDHVLPFALGGEATLENLRLLCRTHNQHRAMRTFGRPNQTPKFL